MLILRRRKNESILIGNDIRITIIECAADGVRLAIDAPKQVFYYPGRIIRSGAD